MIEFLQESKLYVGFIFEVLAAIAGFLYLKKSPFIAPEIKVFIFYLFYIVIIEFYAFIPIYAWINNYEVLSFYEDSLFRRNIWYTNVNLLVYAVCFSQIFIRSLRNKKTRKNLFILLTILVFGSIIRYIISGEFFEKGDIYVGVAETFFVLVCVGYYYFDILRSDRILNFQKDIKFYISVGVVLWSLCVYPLAIYDDYFSLRNPFFMEVNMTVMRYANVFLYSVYIIGFYVDFKNKRRARMVKS